MIAGNSATGLYGPRAFFIPWWQRMERA